jgi:hypothetical protein
MRLWPAAHHIGAQTPSNDHEVLMAQGKSAPVACRDAGISKKN